MSLPFLKKYNIDDFKTKLQLTGRCNCRFCKPTNEKKKKWHKIKFYKRF